MTLPRGSFSLSDTRRWAVERAPPAVSLSCLLLLGEQVVSGKVCKGSYPSMESIVTSFSLDIIFCTLSLSIPILEKNPRSCIGGWVFFLATLPIKNTTISAERMLLAS